MVQAQSLLQQKPKTFEVRLEGSLPEAVTAKDLILAIISEIGVHGGTGRDRSDVQGACLGWRPVVVSTARNEQRRGKQREN